MVRKARAGSPQKVTIHGKDAVVISDAERFEVRPKPRRIRTMAEFIERSKKYRGLTEGIEFEQPFPMYINSDQSIFDDDEK